MQHLLLSISILFAGLLARFLQQWYHHRTRFRGLPQPPHSMIWGHLAIMGETQRTEPPRSAGQTWFVGMRKKYNLPSVFYLDLWPLSDSMMIVADLDVWNQVVGLKGHKGLEKHEVVRKFLHYIGGRTTNLVTSEGSYWKKWRAAFNPGFSFNHLMTLVPPIVEDTVKFRDLLLEKGRTGELFRLDKPCTRLTIDIIGKIVLDHNLNSQFEENPLVSAFESQIRWTELGIIAQPSELIDIRRPYYFRKNTRTMNRYVSKILDERFATIKSRKKQKHVIDLALETYLKEEKGQSLEQATEIDPMFKRHALDHIKTFLFAGHDTTSSTIQYAYYLLAKTPDAMTKIRAEHDEVLGKDPNAAPSVILNDSLVLNKLPYTNAVIKEVLRLYPPASTIRQGGPSTPLYDPKTGQTFPVEKDIMIWAPLPSFHRNEEFWGPKANSFIPDRFLNDDSSGSNSSSQPAFHFGQGPRNCIGQELALIETRIILALTVRSFDVKVCYDELDKLKNDGTEYPNDTFGAQFGDEPYQVQCGTAKPREGMPARIILR